MIGTLILLGALALEIVVMALGFRHQRRVRERAGQAQVRARGME
ncbi:MAG: hypothetical protein WC455_15970 [Dehalococcoidia bacterium]|jgi:hypothetical protein